MSASLLFCSLVLSILVRSDSWYNPPGFSGSNDYSGNPVWLLGSQQTISLSTDLGSWAIYMQQIPSNSPDTLQFITGTTRSSNFNISFNWAVQTYNYSTDVPQIYKFIISNDTSDPLASVDSRPFNVTNDPKAAASAAATSSSSTMNLPTPTTTIGAVSSIPTASSSPLQSAPSSPSHSANGIGLGVGLGVGIPIIALLIALLFLVSRRQKGSQKGGNVDHSPPPVYTSHDSKVVQRNPSETQLRELDNSSRVELQQPPTPVAEAPGDGGSMTSSSPRIGFAEGDIIQLKPKKFCRG